MFKKFSRSFFTKLIVSTLVIAPLVYSAAIPVSAFHQVQEAAIASSSDDDFPPVAGEVQPGAYARAVYGPGVPSQIETSAFLAGKVAVGVIALESSGAPINQEDWTPQELQNVNNEIRAGLQHWEGWAAAAGVNLEFWVDVDLDGVKDAPATAIVPVSIPTEPIGTVSGQHASWTEQALNVIGYTGTQNEMLYQHTGVLRSQGTPDSSDDSDWAFILFVVDSSNDTDATPGAFADGIYMVSRTFGPFAVMTYNNGTLGINNMEWVTAQLTARVFGAGFQFGGCGSQTKKFGYLAIPNSYCEVPSPAGEPSPRLMYNPSGGLPDTLTKYQVGWRDSDGDGIIDPLDTTPKVVFSPYPVNPSDSTTLTYAEGGGRQYRATDIPLIAPACTSADECYFKYYFNDVLDPIPAVTINTIQQVEFRVDTGDWSANVNAADGAFDSEQEIYTFTTNSLTSGKRTIAVRTMNSMGNYSSEALDIVTIKGDAVNDFLVNAKMVPITLNQRFYDDAIDISTATQDPTDPFPPAPPAPPPACGNGQASAYSVWYKFEAQTNENITLDTFGSTYDTILSVWTGTVSGGSLQNPQLIDCNDDAPDSITASKVTFPAEAGITYYILVGEYNNEPPVPGRYDTEQKTLIFHVSAFQPFMESGWAGAVLVKSNHSLVAVGRPHVGSQVMTYNGFGSGSLESYVPMLFKQAWTGYNAALYVQNVSFTATATVSIRYYDTDGNLTCTVNDTITALASKGYWIPGQTCLPAGWVGGAVITSNIPVVSVGRPHIEAEVTSYDGFADGSLDFYIPMLFKQAFDGTYNAALYVQNVHATKTAAVKIWFYDTNGGLTCTISEDIARLSSKGYWMPQQGCLPVGWVGSVVVKSDTPVVAVARLHIGAEITAYNGVDAGSTAMYLPMLFKKAFGGTYNSAFYIQNVDGAGRSAQVTINYHNSNGALVCSKNITVSPLASQGIWTPSETCLADGWTGGATIVSTNNVPIVAVARPHVGAQIMTYTGFAATSNSMYIPMLFKQMWTSYNAAFYIQNVDEGSPAPVTIEFYDATGKLSCVRSDTIPALAIVGYWLPTVTCTP